MSIAVLVLAAGFDSSTGGIAALDLAATDGTRLADPWHDGVVSHLGMAIPGFPNLLMLYGPQSPTAFCNGPTCAELQADWVVDLLRHVRSNGYAVVEPTPEAARRWGEHMRETFRHSLLQEADSWCTGANVPGKKRELLYYPNTQAFLRAGREAVRAGYPGSGSASESTVRSGVRCPRSVLSDSSRNRARRQVLHTRLRASLMPREDIAT